jgi:hypothetical protein
MQSGVFLFRNIKFIFKCLFPNNTCISLILVSCIINELLNSKKLQIAAKITFHGYTLLFGNERLIGPIILDAARRRRFSR